MFQKTSSLPILIKNFIGCNGMNICPVGFNNTIGWSLVRQRRKFSCHSFNKPGSPTYQFQIFQTILGRFLNAIYWLCLSSRACFSMLFCNSSHNLWFLVNCKEGSFLLQPPVKISTAIRHEWMLLFPSTLFSQKWWN